MFFNRSRYLVPSENVKILYLTKWGILNMKQLSGRVTLHLLSYFKANGLWLSWFQEWNNVKNETMRPIEAEAYGMYTSDHTILVITFKSWYIWNVSLSLWQGSSELLWNKGSPSRSNGEAFTDDSHNAVPGIGEYSEIIGLAPQDCT